MEIFLNLADPFFRTDFMPALCLAAVIRRYIPIEMTVLKNRYGNSGVWL